MVAIPVEDLAPERTSKRWQIDWVPVAIVAGAILMLVASVLSAQIAQIRLHIPDRHSTAIAGVAFGIALVLPVIVCWRRAVRDNQLPARNGLEPQYEHVSGWSAIFLIAIVAVIAAVVWWAAQSDDINRKIHSQWGLWIVFGLIGAFILVAAAPLFPRTIRSFGLEAPVGAIARALNSPIDWIGKFLSVFDSMLVFAVANAAGTSQSNVFLRYAILLSMVGACAALGYFWEPPVAFIPIAWGFIVAFSISRRWAWIEGDRELAMLNPRISQAHIRVGFSQNLRDESLVAFLSMFLLVPLALRQAQILADSRAIELFVLSSGTNIDSILTWIAFYGTELAKAVPFVDWAEVYHVEGDTQVTARSDLAQHAIFLTRVLIDLVFLAALLQAISSASRDAQQKELFYKKRTIQHLDPFTEPEEFRMLVRRAPSGEWEENGERFDDFPKYDPNRLVELSANADPRIARAADLLIRRDDIRLDPHHQLSARAADREAKPADIETLLDEIESQGSNRNLYQLALARRRLLSRRSMADARRRIVRLIANYPNPSAERTGWLIEAVVGEQREGYAAARLIALETLGPDTGKNLRVRASLKQAADHDGAQAVKRRAQEFLNQHPETPD